MKRISLLVAAAGLLTLSGAVLAQNSDTAPAAPAAQEAGSTDQGAPADAAQSTGTAQVAEAAPDPGEEVICRRNRATGSLTRVNRICKTRNEWNESGSNTRNAVGEMQRSASGGSMCRGDAAGGC